MHIFFDTVKESNDFMKKLVKGVPSPTKIKAIKSKDKFLVAWDAFDTVWYHYTTLARKHGISDSQAFDMYLQDQKSKKEKEEI